MLMVRIWLGVLGMVIWIGEMERPSVMNTVPGWVEVMMVVVPLNKPGRRMRVTIPDWVEDRERVEERERERDWNLECRVERMKELEMVRERVEVLVVESWSWVGEIRRRVLYWFLRMESSKVMVS